MAIYTELEDKFNIKLSNPDNLLKIKLDCDNGTRGAVAFYKNNRSVVVKCGKEVEIGRDLQTRIRFDGNANNPGREEIKIIHRFYEENTEILTYTFPDDFTGSPDYKESDKELDYTFFLNVE